VAVHFEGPGEEPILLGYAVPESLSSSLTAWLTELPAKSPEDPAEWVLSLEDPSRALFGKRGPADDEVTFTWQGTKDDTALREQMVQVSELEKWPEALGLYGSADPDEIRRPDRYDSG
jgi:hypothetical protein